MSVFHDIATQYSTTNAVGLIGTNLKQFFILIKLFIATFGSLVVLIGAIIALYRYFSYRFLRNNNTLNINTIRLDLARTIILGLEFFIASDVIETTIAPDFQALGILGLLVVIRTVLNFSLHKEVKELSSIPGSGVDIAEEASK